MQLKLWGTRGSLPRAANVATYRSDFFDLIDAATDQGIESLAEFKIALKTGRLSGALPLGGHTACYEVSRGPHHAIVDMGSGIVDASDAALKRGQKEFDIFVTHMHWDHIIGLPFFVPAYLSDCKINIHHVHANAPESIKLLFNGINFPLKWAELGAQIEFKQIKLYEPIMRGDLSIRAFALDHPGGSFGYRFDTPDGSVSLAVDSESKRVTPDEMGRDLEYYQNLDVLLFDGQYDLDELAHRFDWGHSSPPIGVDIALREGIKNILLSHHDPQRTTSASASMLDRAKQHALKQLDSHKDKWQELGQPEGTRIHNAYDQMTITFKNHNIEIANPWESE